LLASLEQIVRNLKLKNSQTEWRDYYNNTNYSASATKSKISLVQQFARRSGAATVFDVGGNDGAYSRALHAQGVTTVCADIDPHAVEANYRQTKHSSESKMLPLLIDLTNPGGALGWANAERSPLPDRIQVDIVMALAVVHHLAISNNLPLGHIAQYFASFGPWLIIEFVPKSDSQTQKLLASREDIYPSYTREGFEEAFSKVYKIHDYKEITGTERILYNMKRI
jgi:ribosomal protein L11 methylase PrmA